jgi:hypothetical protein
VTAPCEDTQALIGNMSLSTEEYGGREGPIADRDTVAPLRHRGRPSTACSPLYFSTIRFNNIARISSSAVDTVATADRI